MPEGGVTRARIRDHLRRLWYAYLIAAVLALFLNHLVFTMTRPSASEDATLKLLVINAGVSIDEEALLEKTAHLGFEAVEWAPIAVSPGDLTGEMLLMVQLTGGFGDIYIADAAGRAALDAKDACLQPGLQLESGLYIAAAVNGTTPDSALAALPILAEMITE